MNARALFVSGILAVMSLYSMAQPSGGGAPEPISVWPKVPGIGANEPEPILTYAEPDSGSERGGRRFEGSWDVEVSYRRPLNGDYQGLFRAMTSLNYILDGRNSFGLEAGGGVLELKRRSWAHAVARDPLVLEGGFNYRHFFTHPKAFLRPYATIRLQWFVFIWDYREPVETEDRTLHMDYVWGVDPSAGFGITVQPTRRLSLYGEVEAGGMFISDCVTERGVLNDFLDNFGYVGLRAGLRLQF